MEEMVGVHFKLLSLFLLRGSDERETVVGDITFGRSRSSQYLPLPVDRATPRYLAVHKESHGGEENWRGV
jgi:hypothetical protein